MGDQRDGENGPRYKSRGAMIMKTVSILLVNSRRVSNQRREKSAAAAVAKKRKIKMDEGAGKVTPKLLDSLKKRTHFSKYFCCFVYVLSILVQLCIHLLVISEKN